MTTSIVARLVAKDWYLLRTPLLGYLGGGLIAVLLLTFGGAAAFNLGSLLMITILIALGMHVVMATVVAERTEHTLPFIMTLPLSIAQYTTAKVLANVSIFAAGWIALSVGVSIVVLFREGVPHGLIVLSTITMLEILAQYFVVLAVAITTESMPLTIVTVVVGNIFLNVLFYSLARVPEIVQTYTSPKIVWPHAALTLMLCEIAVIFIALIVTFGVQLRKSNFL